MFYKTYKKNADDFIVKTLLYYFVFSIVWVASYSICHADWVTNQVGNALQISRTHPDGTIEMRMISEDPTHFAGKPLFFNEVERDFLDILKSVEPRQRPRFFASIGGFGVKLQGSKIPNSTLKMYPTETDVELKRSMLYVMRASQDPKCKAIFLEAAKSDSPVFCGSGASFLIDSGDVQGVGILIDMLPSMDRKDQVSTLESLSRAVRELGLDFKPDEKAIEAKPTGDERIAVCIRQWQEWWRKNKSKYIK